MRNSNTASDTPDDDDDELSVSGVKHRSFTVRGRRNPHKTYTFKNFDSARQGPLLFQTTEATLAQKKALYDELVLLHEETALRTERLERRGIVVLGVSVIEIPIHFLTVDLTWARTKLVDWNHVADIAMDFHPKSMAVPSVSVRCEYDDAGNLIDVIYSLTDGVHRVVGVKEVGHTHVAVSIQLVNTVREEAEISSDCNYGRRPHAGIDILKNRIASEEERILQLKALVERCGFTLSSQPGKHKVWPEIGCYPTLERIIKRYGEETLERVLNLLSDPKFTHWHGHSVTMTADMLAGLALYVHEFERPGFIHSNMTEHLLMNTTPVLILNLAQQVSKPLASDIFNRAVCPSAKDLNSEDGRSVRVCAAFVNSVKELFKANKRPKTNYLPKFKTAFELFYTDAETRSTEIAVVRNFCSRKGMPDYWWLKKNNGLTR